MLRLHIMEFFGFTCGNSAADPNYQFMSESVLKDYPTDITEDPALSSILFSPYDYVPIDFASVYQTFVDSYLPILQTPKARGVGAGLLTAAVMYCGWKLSFSSKRKAPSFTSGVDGDLLVKNNKVPRVCKTKERGKAAPNKSTANLPSSRLAAANNTTGKGSKSETKQRDDNGQVRVSESFQRQLMEVTSKLDEFRFRVKELESEKELLAAEIELRKKITKKLQMENSSEREKRQQAELKMEMMEIENAQLRQLRKEMVLKTGQMEKLEKFIKEKDDMNTKLFENNVVLPRAVAETRAREFGNLQSRVHQLQAEVEATKRLLESSPGSSANKSLSSVWPTDGSLSPSLPMTCQASVPLKASHIAETSVVLPINSSCPGRGHNMKRKLTEKSPNISRSHTKLPEKSPKIIRSGTSPAFNISAPKPQEKAGLARGLCGVVDSQPTTDMNASSTATPCKAESVVNTVDSPSVKSTGVFAHIRALISGFSSSESEFVNQLEPSLNSNEPEAPIQHTDAETDQEYPTSDEQSSVFMSASGGSGTSDTDYHDEPTRSAKSQSKKSFPVKRLLKKYKRGRKRDKVLRGRLSSQFSVGQPPVVDLPDDHSDSSDYSHRSTVKNYPIARKEASGSRVSSKGTCDNQEVAASALESSDENNCDSGDSWIVLMPAASQVGT